MEEVKVAPISAFDFEVIQSVMKQFAAAGTTDPDDLRQLARTIAKDYCPDGDYSDDRYAGKGGAYGCERV